MKKFSIVMVIVMVMSVILSACTSQAAQAPMRSKRQSSSSGQLITKKNVSWLMKLLQMLSWQYIPKLTCGS